jgi:polyhydroxyalkanoate synthesis regulator phasin
MHKLIRNVVLLTAVAMLAAFAVGATTASAHGGRGGGGIGGASAGALVTEAAKQLGVTRATLVAAIEKAAVARIDEAVEDGDVDADDADDLKDEAQDSLRFAMHVSRTRTVAANLNITAAKLNTEFRDARRALILAKIDEAVEDGDLEADEAAELKEELEDAELPGYKPFARGFGFGFGFGGPGGPGGRR